MILFVPNHLAQCPGFRLELVEFAGLVPELIPFLLGKTGEQCDSAYDSGF